MEIDEYLNSKYYGDSSIKQLFYWMWNNLKERIPDIACEVRKRYVGLYPKGEDRIFAYLDFKKNELSIGIFEDVFDKVEPKTYKYHRFPRWNNSKERNLVGISDIKKNEEILYILEACYIERVSGIWAVEKMPSGREIESQQKYQNIRSIIKKDIDILDLEEEKIEGQKKQRLTNYYERDPVLRAKAIAFHGLECMICGFSFKDFYGRIGTNFIEVHHLTPLCQLNTPTQVDPYTEMIVVCSNCHRMLHRSKKTLSPQELMNKLHNNYMLPRSKNNKE